MNAEALVSPLRNRLAVQLIAWLAAAWTATAANYEWKAAWGWLPNELGPGMTLVNSFPTNPPVLQSGTLRIRTSSDPGGTYYICTGTNFTAPASLVIETEVRVLTNYSSVPFRAGVNVAFTLATNVGNVLFIGAGEIFISNGHATHGPSAAVDTEGSFHTYRIEVDGVTVNSAVRVYQDGILRITGSLYEDAPDLGLPRLFFGDGSSFASGTSDWKYFSHNAAVQPATVRPVLSIARPATVGLHGLPGRHYQIQSTTNIVAPVWIPRAALDLTTDAVGSVALSPPFLPTEFFQAQEIP